MHAACPVTGKSSTAPAAAQPLSEALKLRTREQHDAAEAAPLHELMFGSRGPAAAREAYTHSLAQHLHIQQAFEPALRRVAETHTGIAAMIQDYHFQLPALRADLDYLGSPERPPVPSTTTLATFISACAARRPAMLLGVWYVFEGATNGGTIIAKRLREVLRLEGIGHGAEPGTSYINPHGPLVRARWAQWKAGADAIAWTAEDREMAIAAAQETFRLIGAMMTEVYGQLAAPAAR